MALFTQMMYDEECDELHEEEKLGGDHEFIFDLDYEFDAPKYIDLSKEESTMQATMAEKWFDAATSDDPRPSPTMESLCDYQLPILDDDDESSSSLCDDCAALLESFHDYQLATIEYEEPSDAICDDSAAMMRLLSIDCEATMKSLRDDDDDDDDDYELSSSLCDDCAAIMKSLHDYEVANIDYYEESSGAICADCAWMLRSMCDYELLARLYDCDIMN